MLEDICGNGIKTGTEACDDGNTNSNDGCSATCTLEATHDCNVGTNPSVCTCKDQGGVTQYLNGGTCGPNCPAQKNPVAHTCVTCFTGCLFCTGPGVNECVANPGVGDDCDTAGGYTFDAVNISCRKCGDGVI